MEVFSLHYIPYQYAEKEKFLEHLKGVKFKGKRGKSGVKIANVASSFDIETTSFYYDRGDGVKEKGATMYIWQFGFNGYVIYGRKWSEFVELINDISERLKLSDKKRLAVYVHNLSYEFQFMRLWFNWFNVFAKDIRKPLYAINAQGIEFRCSYMLSNYSLEKVGEHLQKYKVKKLVGTLDYDKIRHYETPLSDDELSYCVNDVLVVMAYIQEYIERENGNINNIPLTNTGVVRKFVRKRCIRGEHSKDVKNYEAYRRVMNSLVIDGEKEYRQLKRAFAGGFTHANAFYTGKTLYNVHSFDFTSSYPYVMLSEKFPMSKGEKVEVKTTDELKKYLNLYCCIFEITFYNISPLLSFENPISKDKCIECVNGVINNGRIVTADKITLTITEVDFWVIKRFYTYEKAEIFNCRIYQKDYLPKNFILAILELYSKKTELKGIEGKEVEYMVSKNMLNSSYGMSVTDIVHEEIIYNNDWDKAKGDAEKEIEKYNKSKNRFLFYAWGVYVTAYARKNLFTGILEVGKDYIYSDTDSIKFLNLEKHNNYFYKYNNYVLEKLKRTAKNHNIDFEKFTPKNKKGEVKIIGVWEYEGLYDKFKTLGAKRYLVEKNGKTTLTVAGVGKKQANEYLNNKYKERIFDAFNNNLFIPKEHTGKLTHTYFDDELNVYLTDYKGKTVKVYEKSFTHLEKAEFTLSMSGEYLDYLRGISTDEN